MPFTRRMAAAMPAIPSTINTLRRKFTALTSVGLTRIELVTSSLSGMRSNQLSYSPELLGVKSLTALFLTLNRGRHLFLQHRHPHPANEVRDQIEHDSSKHPDDRAKCG